MARKIYGGVSSVAENITKVYAGVSESYRVLNYIECSGTQFINTEIYPFHTMIEMQIQLPSIPSSSSGNGFFAGSWSSNDNRYYALQVAYAQSPQCFRTANRSNTYTILQNLDTNIHTIIYNDSNNRVYWDGVQKTTVSDLTTQSEQQLYLFCRPSADYVLSGRIYYSKITDKSTNTLIRDLIPVKRISDNEIGMYDRVSHRFFKNGGTGTFTAGSEQSDIINVANQSKKVLKVYAGVNNVAEQCFNSDYEFLNYIQSSGTEYIDTGLKPTQNTKVEIQYMPLNLSSSNAYLIGSSVQPNSNRLQLAFKTNSTFFGWADNYTNISGDVSTTSTIAKIEEGKLYIDNVLKYTLANNSFDNNALELYLFALNSQNSAVAFLSGRIYYCKFFDNNQLIKYFVPAKRKSDNEIGLLDLVNNVFYTNQGTGTFLYG